MEQSIIILEAHEVVEPGERPMANVERDPDCDRGSYAAVGAGERPAEGWLYLAGVMDLYSRKIVGWEMSGEMKADLVENALCMALYQRQPNSNLLHHSDRGSQYASNQLQTILRANRIQVSMSRKGDCYDNSVIELFQHAEMRVGSHSEKRNRAQSRTGIFSYIEAFYNTVRIHSTLGYLSPNDVEAKSVVSPLLPVHQTEGNPRLFAQSEWVSDSLA